MATPTYTAIASITLGSSASSVTFSSLPQEFSDIVFIMYAATSSNSNNILRFNNDSGSNYFGVYMTGSGGASTAAIGPGPFAQTDSSAFTTTTLGEQMAEGRIFDYSATNKHKTLLVKSSRPEGATDLMAFRYASNSALTSITFQPNNGSYTFLNGSKFEIYGIEA